MNSFSENLKYDFPAAIVVWLVALPLCLGIALASGAPLFSGLIAGIIGGIVVGFASGSNVSVSGPAAGLTVIVLNAITELGSFQIFILAVFLAGLIQIILGYLKAGIIGNFFPSSVIKGMLAAIGLILILKQIPHALGYDKDAEGDLAFMQADGENTFSEILNAFSYFSPGAIIISFTGLAVLILWETKYFKSLKWTKILPGPLIVVALGILLNEFFEFAVPSLEISRENLVSLPIFDEVEDFESVLMIPAFGQITNPQVWIVAFTIAIVASLETLLSIDAADKLDTFKRRTPLNRELKAQGLGNMISGLIGGLPLTAVIVRTSANVASGARSKYSAVIHGILLVATTILVPSILNMIPLSALAAVLLLVGYKLIKPSTIKAMYKKGWSQFVPFAVTIIAIMFTDLLIGIMIGMVVGIYFVVRTNFREAVFIVNDKGNYLVKLTKDVSFLNKVIFRKRLEQIPDGSFVIIDGSRSRFIDNDILESIEDFCNTAPNRNITVEVKRSIAASNPYFQAA